MQRIQISMANASNYGTNSPRVQSVGGQNPRLNNPNTNNPSLRALRASSSDASSTHNTQSQYKLSFLGMMNSEWIKIRSTRSFLAMTLTGLVLVIGAAVVCALINPSDIWSSSDTQDAANSIYMVFLSILASKVIIDDYQTGTIVVAVATVRNRAKLIMAKIATLLLSLSILTAIVSALAVFVQIPIINLKTGNLIDPFVATQTYSPIFSFVIFPVAVALLSLIAFGVGLIIRSSAVTTLTVIAYLFFTDVLIGTFCTIVMDNYDLGESIKRWFPNGLFERFCNGLFESHSVTTPVVPGSKQMITETTYNYSHLVFSSEFLAATAGIVAWVGVLVIIGTAIFKKRDV